MTPREQLEYAAKAMGLKIVPTPGRQLWIEDGKRLTIWNPITDQAESDRMACKLRINTLLVSKGTAYCFCDNIGAEGNHNSADEDVYRAVREARMAVAVEIGRMK
jgi:hypothetical protein